MQKLNLQFWNDVVDCLQKPFDGAMERVLELSIKHAKPWTVKEKSLLDRIQFALSTALYLGTLPLSIPLWMIGSGLDAAMQKCGATAYIYIKGLGQEKRGDIQSVATWNVCMLQLGLPIPFGGMAPTADRVHDVARQIIDANPDIICLQEVSSRAGDLLIRELKNYYTEFYKVRGLFVASKYHVEEPSARYLPHSGFVNRVVFSFKVNALNFFTTHLDPRNPQNRQEQIAEITFEDQPTIFLGDLNMKRGKEPLPLGFQDSLSDAPVTATDRFMGDPNNDISIDYILGRGVVVTSSVLEAYDQVRGWGNSDHKMLVGYVQPV
jgi:endonuclease/exonuclease/phosphatase family metal-dependent hydrolase